MKSYTVSFRVAADQDLDALSDFIEEQSGHTVADRFIERIEAACLALENFPKRGKAWDEIRPGLRTVGFERTVTIAFVVTGNAVVITRIFYRGRDFEALLRSITD